MAETAESCATSAVIILSTDESSTRYCRYPERRIRLDRVNTVCTVGRSPKDSSKALLVGRNNAWFESPIMSRQHAEILVKFDEKKFFVKDNHSLHGTFYNKERVRMDPDKPRQLISGDNLRFGIPIYKGNEVFAPISVKVDCVFQEACVFTMKPSSRPALLTGPESATASRVGTFRVPDSEPSDISDEYDSDNSSPVTTRPRAPPVPAAIERPQSDGHAASRPIDLTGDAQVRAEDGVIDLTSAPDEDADIDDLFEAAPNQTVAPVIDLSSTALGQDLTPAESANGFSQMDKEASRFGDVVPVENDMDTANSQAHLADAQPQWEGMTDNFDSGADDVTEFHEHQQAATQLSTLDEVLSMPSMVDDRQDADQSANDAESGSKSENKSENGSECGEGEPASEPLTNDSEDMLISEIEEDNPDENELEDFANDISLEPKSSSSSVADDEHDVRSEDEVQWEAENTHDLDLGFDPMPDLIDDGAVESIFVCTRNSDLDRASFLPTHISFEVLLNGADANSTAANVQEEQGFREAFSAHQNPPPTSRFSPSAPKMAEASAASELAGHIASGTETKVSSAPATPAATALARSTRPSEVAVSRVLAPAPTAPNASVSPLHPTWDMHRHPWTDVSAISPNKTMARSQHALLLTSPEFSLSENGNEADGDFRSSTLKQLGAKSGKEAFFAAWEENKAAVNKLQSPVLDIPTERDCSGQPSKRRGFSSVWDLVDEESDPSAQPLQFAPAALMLSETVEGGCVAEAEGGSGRSFVSISDFVESAPGRSAAATGKRKADVMSEADAEDLEWEASQKAAMGSRHDVEAQETHNHSVRGGTRTWSALHRHTLPQAHREAAFHNSNRNAGALDKKRPSKKLRRVLERAAYACLGGATVGAVVVGSLIYTAPSFA